MTDIAPTRAPAHRGGRRPARLDRARPGGPHVCVRRDRDDRHLRSGREGVRRLADVRARGRAGARRTSPSIRRSSCPARTSWSTRPCSGTPTRPRRCRCSSRSRRTRSVSSRGSRSTSERSSPACTRSSGTSSGACVPWSSRSCCSGWPSFVASPRASPSATRASGSPVCSRGAGSSGAGAPRSVCWPARSDDQARFRARPSSGRHAQTFLRVVLAALAVGGALFVLTLPLVGIQSWFDYAKALSYSIPACGAEPPDIHRLQPPAVRRARYGEAGRDRARARRWRAGRARPPAAPVLRPGGHRVAVTGDRPPLPLPARGLRPRGRDLRDVARQETPAGTNDPAGLTGWRIT